jgi:hypothetical protein
MSPCQCVGDAIGLPLGGLQGLAHGQLRPAGGPRGAVFLLYDVGQLMGEQAPSLGRTRRKGAGPEHDVSPRGVRPRSQRSGRGGRSVIAVYAHSAEVAAETPAHVSLGRRVERTTT